MGDFGIAGLWVLLALSLVASVLVAAGGMWLAERTLSKPVSEGHNGALSPFLTCVGLVYGALLGFVIVVAWEQFSSAETNVSNEASTLITMYRQTVGMPVPEQTQMRVLLRKYTSAVEGPEWENAIRQGTGTEGARDALNEMYRLLGGEQSSVASSPISQRFLDQLGTLASERNQRILDAKPRIPGLLWTGLLFGGVVLLGLGGFMRPGERACAFRSAERCRRPARVAAVHCLLAGPSLREPVRRHVRTVRAITKRFRLDRCRNMIIQSRRRPPGRTRIPH
jgi:Protein of unknown function (DUF4239)